MTQAYNVIISLYGTKKKKQKKLLKWFGNVNVTKIDKRGKKDISHNIT